MNTKRLTFEDISIVHEGSNVITSFIPQLTKILRYHSITERIQWTTSNKNYSLSENGTVMKKVGQNSWQEPIHSVTPLKFTGNLCYFQMKILKLNDSDSESGSGVFIGVSHTNTIGEVDWTGAKAICIYNTSGTGLDTGSVEHKGTYHIIKGDVAGVVVDMERDQVRFYKNAKLIAVSNRKPSEMMPLYAATWLYFEKCEIEMGDYFPYPSLEPYYE